MTSPPARSRRRAVLLAGAGLIPVGMAAVAALALAAPTYAASPKVTSSNPYAVAPYVDMSNGQEGLLDTAVTQHGLKAYTAAFVIGVGCNQEWGDTLPVGNDSFTDPEIARAKSEGASVIISSGGADGEPLAWTCTNQGSIESGYQQIISDYGINQLDFDVEGAAIADTGAAARQMQAMKDLKASNPGLRFSVTMPVLPSGLTSDGVNVLRAAKNAGIRIDVVNIMAMDYYQGTGAEMGQAAISAAQSTMTQMKSVDSGYTYADLGLTPMIGVNDDGSTFTLSDAQTVENWASQNGLGRLSFWSITRDQSCPGGNGGGASSTCSGVSESQLAFTSAFVPFNGGGGVTPPPTTTTATPPPTTTTTTNPGGGGCAAAWSASTSYVPGDEVSYSGHNYTATYWSTDVPPTSPIAWDIWKDDGAC